jgi:choline dehydrogenase
MREAAIRAYDRDHTGPLHSGLLELVGFPRIDMALEQNKKYAAAKKANGES